MFQFKTLFFKQSFFGVALGAHRNILPDSHRQRSCGKSRHSGSKDKARRVGSTGNADDNGGNGNDAIIGAKNRGPQPI